MKDRLRVGFHTGAFNTAYFSFWRAADWATADGIRNLECGFVDGVCWNHGLGHFPHLASWEDVKMKESIEWFRSLLDSLDYPHDVGFPTGKDTRG